MKKYYFGIDVGGTFIKGAIVDSDGNIKVSAKVPTESEKGRLHVSANIKTLCDNLLEKSGLNKSDITAIGMGVPGMIDSERGIVIKSNNLRWQDFPIAKEVEKLTELPVKIANDANAATLGECKFALNGKYKNIVFLTLGTGIGGGIVINGELYEGNRGAGAELGHSVIVMNGEPCTCGRRGCIEAYASATAIIRETKKAMNTHKDSKLWEIGSLDAVNGKTAFDYSETDVYAKEVVDNYISALACYITNISNEFRPEAVILGGGVCAQGEALINPLKEILKKDIFAGSTGPQVEILTAKLGNDAGCLGAAALVI